jgi:hypothetical protein
MRHVRILDDEFFCRSGTEVIGDLGFEGWLVALERLVTVLIAYELRQILLTSSMAGSYTDLL